MEKKNRIRNKRLRMVLAFLLVVNLSCSEHTEEVCNMTDATILISENIKTPFDTTTADILIEEIEKRTTLRLSVEETWKNRPIIALALQDDKDIRGLMIPKAENEHTVRLEKEGFRLQHLLIEGQHVILITGADIRGVLYGIGKFLRILETSKGNISVKSDLDVKATPKYALRGHQFGYRNTANSWDSWTVEQFDQHFREQVLFGANSFENIPFQDPNSSVHFKIDPQQMEVKLSKICAKYDVGYWAWTPAPEDLTAKNAHEIGLQEQEEFYARCPRLNGIFVPGGDPGENHPSVLIPYLEDLSKILLKYHPNAGIWVSLQGFNEEKTTYFFEYLKNNKPDWLRGLVNGPSSPPLAFERSQLPKKYQYRFYPDITHTVRCHYPVERWDQAYALTLGREPCNPQPRHYAELFRRDVPHTDGFITYSDGSHDDLNKVVWSQLGFDSDMEVKNIVSEYCRFFFGSDVVEEATEGIFSLEKNWEGPLLGNVTVKNTLGLWQALEREHATMNSSNWRWQQLIMRAYYDAYIQDRLTYEKKLEENVYKILAEAKNLGADEAMAKALQELEKVDKTKVSPHLREKVFQYAEALFESIGAQTSVPKYGARSAERGAILDFIDYPLNNRWWLEDQFKDISQYKTEKAKLERLDFIRTYEHPGEGSFYDNISSADAQHVTSETDDAIDYLWENDGRSRKRLSTQLFQFTPTLSYENLEPKVNYMIRVSGLGEALLRANGERLKPTKYEKGFEEFKEFPVPADLIEEGRLKISFDKPDEEHLNWRKQSRVTDVWLLKQ
ncbi:alpha-glucuronidase family glycosyl hydrolase [Pareuzebyella sediminis]|uniref:alpha-glucuronidase family glycosyl hydrolase n=1 Tax=Pareuzebyella sediminis TaxID=2607998 RepID=UPI0018E0F256|nr:alpha-glucuronidase family glycosyl hydrolase [Pareuzebyella sediminis]